MADYQGIQLYGGPIAVKKDGTHVGGLIMVPENIPHYYVETGDSNKSKLQVVAVGYASNGTLPSPPDAQFQAPGFHTYAKPAGNPATDKMTAVALINQALVILNK